VTKKPSRHNFIPYTGRQRWMDPATTFTRQEIAERSGLSDDVLSFWSKRGLLVAAEGGEGKGSHRRYDAAQINIAAILAVYRDHFGANIAVMKSLSDLMQGAVATFRKVALPIGEWVSIARIADDLHAFRSGRDVMVRVHNYDDPDYESLEIDEKLRKRPAANEAEILAEFDRGTEAPMGVLIRTAERIGPGHVTDAMVARVIDGILIDPEYSSGEMWLLRQTGNGWDLRWGTDEISFDLDDADDFGPAAFIPIGAIIRRIWNIPRSKHLRNVRYANTLQEVLDKHGLKAVVTPADDERFYVYIDAPEALFDAIAPLAKETISYFALRDPSQSDIDKAKA
jgi:DNA-binding transcriptional MerR regulator